jgi:hypothetical protein
MSFYLPHQGRKICVKGRLSARNANSIDPALKRVEVTQNLFKRDRTILFRMKNERMVMAVRAAEIAIRKEEHRAYFSWPIHKGGF